jgi:hypothetical protein
MGKNGGHKEVWVDLRDDGAKSGRGIDKGGHTAAAESVHVKFHVWRYLLGSLDNNGFKIVIIAKYI